MVTIRNYKQDAVGDGRPRRRCRHLANWTKHSLHHVIMMSMMSSTKPKVITYCITARGPNRGRM